MCPGNICGENNAIRKLHKYTKPDSEQRFLRDVYTALCRNYYQNMSRIYQYPGGFRRLLPGGLPADLAQQR